MDYLTQMYLLIAFGLGAFVQKPVPLSEQER